MKDKREKRLGRREREREMNQKEGVSGENPKRDRFSREKARIRD